MSLTSYRTSAVGGNTTTGTSPTATITPVVGDLFIVFCQAVGNTNATPTCSDNNSGSYTLLFAEGSNTNGNYLSCFVRTALLANTTSTVVTVATGAHSAAEVCVVAVSGAVAAGASAILQNAVQANQAASTTPTLTLSKTVTFGSIVLSAVGNATNPGGITNVINTSQLWNWTREQNVGQTACGLCVASSSQGIYGGGSQGVTWGSTSASVFASCAIEVGVAPVNAGVNVSKLNSYGVLAPPIGVDVSKLVSYGVLAPPTGVAVSKLVAYAVLNAINTNPPVWPSLSPPPGYVGNPYTFTWDLTTAASPTTYTLYSGSLPPGLSLSNIIGGDGNQGEITGTPTTVGSYSFVVTATNAYGVVNSPTLTITVATAVGVTTSYAFIG